MAEQQKPPVEVEDERALVARIRASHGTDDVVRTVLKTDERVIARVTDGIYRQPGSALRELISNAYDADATRVVLKTDAPRFERISVEDDGHGMPPEVLAHLLLHIGGSAKRNDVGASLGRPLVRQFGHRRRRRDRVDAAQLVQPVRRGRRRLVAVDDDAAHRTSSIISMACTGHCS